MKRRNTPFVPFTLFLAFLIGCAGYGNRDNWKLTSIQVIDRNGFRETIDAKERLAIYAREDFLAHQPYGKVIRVYARNREGKVPARITTYHKNGEPWQYLDVIDGRASGAYREWHPNGHLYIEAHVVEGLGDLSEEAQMSWVFDGTGFVWDERHCPVAKIDYEKGDLQGDALYYRADGSLWKKVPYREGKREGALLHYDERGEIIGWIPFSKDQRNGIALFKGDRETPPYFEEYTDDLLMEATYWNFSNDLIERIDKGQGRRPTFAQGRLHSLEEYCGGVQEGRVEVFDDLGNLSNCFEVKDGLKSGEEWIYFPLNGQGEYSPKLFLTWYRGKVHGICRSWYENGLLESEREVCNNRKEGVSSSWYVDGSLMLIEEYEDDRLIEGIYRKRGDSRAVSSVENGRGVATLYDPEGIFLKRVPYENGEPDAS